ncbi:MAG: helix-turn-helix domain-containing protein [Defluviicoccus sp.]|nr:MAG: helix-turn-helix domain-containing protein [Defluviicoccus sp.]
MADEILTIREVAELLKINEKTAYKLASAGKIPGFKVGGSWRFQRQEIANWIKRKVEEQQGAAGAHDERSRHLPKIRCAQAAIGRLG